MDKSLSKSGALLAPDFAIKVAKAVLTRAPHMAEKDLVDALNKCQSMAAKAQLLSHRGLGHRKDPLSEMRKLIEGTVDDNLEPIEDVDDDTDDGMKEETHGQEESQPSGPDIRVS